MSLFGWHANSDVNWRVVDGVIRADEGPIGLLLTHVPFADFEFRCDFRLEKGGNSGVFLRTVADPKNPAVDCYELNICDTHPEFPTGSLVGRRKVAALPKTDGQWHTFHVVAQGLRIQVQLDGKPLLDFTDTSQHPRRSGFLGLQKNEGRIEFRHLALRPLSMQPLFNGKDLSGWRVVPDSQGRFEVEDGTIHLTGGRGFLETEGTWADFILQCEVRTEKSGVNSGIFFRALPSVKEAHVDGYEVQIHNGFADGDRTRPTDGGTGGIFRRAPARRVVSDDRSWCTITLVAHGDRLATWVNGYPVVAWRDERPDDENPRRGRRLAAGHISLQAHDPTTDIRFRNLRLAAFPD